MIGVSNEKVLNRFDVRPDRIFSFCRDVTDYIEYKWEAYEKWAEMVVKYNATQWMDDGNPTWAMFELFCEKYPCTDFWNCEEEQNGC